MTAPLAVHSTTLPPEARVAAWTPDVKDKMAAWSRSAQTTTRAMQSLSLRSQPIIFVSRR